MDEDEQLAWQMAYEEEEQNQISSSLPVQKQPSA
jgi:hypothetical protein